MEEIRLSAPRLVALLLLSTFCAVAGAQTSPQDGIDRNLLQRQQQSSDFHVRLYDAGKAAGRDALIPLPPVPHSFIGPELYQAPSVGASNSGAKVGVLPDAANQELNDSQLRRQLELQTQNKLFDEPTRQQQSQIQQLQFGRENQAQQLQQQIQRDSSNLMQRSR
jgi:beta-glucosidase-like glycosyl hydrolase